MSTVGKEIFEKYEISYNTVNNFQYDVNYLTRVTHNNFAFDFTYDQLGRSKMIKVAGEELASFTYTDGQTSTVTTTSPNNNTSVITYDSHGNPTSQKINDKLIFEATYSTSGVLEKYVDELR